jgi:dTDP-4-dehydrorhamnose 3,5-epimerase
MEFRKGPIQDVVVTPLRKFADERGWLSEIFRQDEVPASSHPAMGYVSLTLPGVVRGPHEHVDQTDLFCFLGPGEFKLTLWDNRPQSATFLNRLELVVGEANPASVLVPPGVVHGYRCVSFGPGSVINCPNRLFAGTGKAEPVDEIRHEDDPANPFVVDEATRRMRFR